MKLVSYLKEENDQLGILVDGIIYDTETLHPDLPGSMSLFLNFWDDSLDLAQAGMDFLKSLMNRNYSATTSNATSECWPLPKSILAL